MRLTPRERDRLMLFLAAELARRRRANGLKLNYPEARALIADEICEGARAGASVSDLMSLGSSLLTAEDVMPGVPVLIGMLQVEAVFPDGQKLVTVHQPIVEDGQKTEDAVVPGEVRTAEGEIVLNEGRDTVRLVVSNRGDRPIQVGSHYHFFEVNRELVFDRASSFGMRLDIPAGTAMRFEPGDEKEVDLVALGGERQVRGLNRLTEGALDEPDVAEAALLRAAERGFGGLA